MKELAAPGSEHNLAEERVIQRPYKNGHSITNVKTNNEKHARYKRHVSQPQN
jgi:hypothetical protein